MTIPDKLKELQRQALEAVSDMPDGDLKTKAFEVFLRHLLEAQTQASPPKPSQAEKAAQKPTKSARQPGTVKSRILLLKDGSFFGVPRSINDVKEELRVHGWIHATTDLSGRLQSLVRERHLRRVKEKTWKYVNP
jgi:hypothetical protein